MGPRDAERVKGVEAIGIWIMPTRGLPTARGVASRREVDRVRVGPVCATRPNGSGRTSISGSLVVTSFSAPVEARAFSEQLGVPSRESIHEVRTSSLPTLLLALPSQRIIAASPSAVELLASRTAQVRRKEDRR